MKLQRLRAFNETGLRMLREGADLPLVTSFAETDAATELPLEWRSQLKIARKLGEGSFGTVYKCKVLCANTSSYVTVKFIEGKSSMVKREIKLLKAMRGISDFCTSAIGSPSSIETATGYWIMTHSSDRKVGFLTSAPGSKFMPLMNLSSGCHS